MSYCIAKPKATNFNSLSQEDIDNELEPNVEFFRGTSDYLPT